MKITEREKKVLDLRDNKWTYKKIGERFGFSTERARQINMKALRKIDFNSKVDSKLPINNKSSIFRLDVPVRAHNALRSSNINTIGDIIKGGSWELLKIKNLGKKSVCAIRNELSRYGFYTWNFRK